MLRVGPGPIMLNFLSIMLLSSAQKITHYAHNATAISYAIGYKHNIIIFTLNRVII